MKAVTRRSCPPPPQRLLTAYQVTSDRLKEEWRPAGSKKGAREQLQAVATPLPLPLLHEGPRCSIFSFFPVAWVPLPPLTP